MENDNLREANDDNGS